MKILVTGNQGYIGSEFGKALKEHKQDIKLYGMDSGLFGSCLSTTDRVGDSFYDVQYFKDIREVDEDDLHNIDIVVSLAAVSNDPIGNDFEIATKEINLDANLKLAENSHKAGVKRMIVASSCSLYGFGGEVARSESDSLNPITAYAKSKMMTEIEMIKKYRHSNFEMFFLRFATACGVSDRLRLDLVLNDFVAEAVGNGCIDVLSDGTPWRPLIDVSEICKALIWACEHKLQDYTTSSYICINVGSDEWNFSVRQLAQIVSECLGSVDVKINTNASPDNRSYKVDFSLYKRLSGAYYPDKSIESSVAELYDMIIALNSHKVAFRDSSFVRLNHLRSMISKKLITDHLRWS